MAARDVIVVTAANAAYMPLLRGLLASLADHAPELPVGVLDLGLEAGDRDELSAAGVALAVPDWHMAPAVRARFAPPPHYRAMSARPHLRDYFPGFACYLWLDADTWIASPAAVETFLAAARSHELAIVPALDVCYARHYGLALMQGKMELLPHYRCLLPDPLGQDLLLAAELVVGAFAMRADSPLWTPWAEEVTTILAHAAATSNFLPFLFEQVALNLVVHRRPGSAALLPARFDWLLGEAVPLLDEASGRLCAPQPPYDRIEVLHLVHAGRGVADKMAPVATRTLAGTPVRLAFNYEAVRDRSRPESAEPGLPLASIRPGRL
jgi:hypothetical protein